MWKVSAVYAIAQYQTDHLQRLYGSTNSSEEDIEAFREASISMAWIVQLSNRDCLFPLITLDRDSYVGDCVVLDSALA